MMITAFDYPGMGISHSNFVLYLFLFMVGQI